MTYASLYGSRLIKSLKCCASTRCARIQLILFTVVLCTWFVVNILSTNDGRMVKYQKSRRHVLRWKQKHMSWNVREHDDIVRFIGLKRKHDTNISALENKNTHRSSQSSDYNDHTSNYKLKFMISADEFRSNIGAKTGNPLIDDYDNNSLLGRNVSDREVELSRKLLDQYNMNVVGSDTIPLNRAVPDSRPQNCGGRRYPTDLPTASVIVPFYNEWPSFLIRTVYSIINRSPRHLIKEIVLVDDASTLDTLGENLTRYVDDHFPRGLVILLRRPVREGLIKARLAGWKVITADVVIFFDSHMEVNHNWLPPLLTQIRSDRTSVAMATLDYIHRETLKYEYYHGYQTRYGFDWKLLFFETFWRSDQLAGKDLADNKPGPMMVGAAFAIESNYFREIGTYDEGMTIWGGENLEMSWRVWLCGGCLIHVPCSHIGHVARPQPYSFPGGRRGVEVYNYKRAVDVWMGEHVKFVYNSFPEMKKLNSGDITERIKLKERLSCKHFSWYLTNIWPELSTFDKDAQYWGQLSNKKTQTCVDNSDYLFPMTDEKAKLKYCSGFISQQAVSLKRSGRLEMSLQCIIVMKPTHKVALRDCIEMEWTHTWKYNATSLLMRHVSSRRCLTEDGVNLVVLECKEDDPSQQWVFTPFPDITKYYSTAAIDMDNT